jgi:Na+(H+)/acetate symporter ActP
MNTDVAEARNFVIWMVLWIGALMVLLPALAGS